MIRSDKVLEAVDRSRELLSTLGARELGGFALIFPPEADRAIEVILLDSAGDQKSFFALLRDKLVVSQEQASYGAVSMPRGMGR